MIKKFGSAIFLIFVVTFFSMSLFESLLTKVRRDVLNDYFCSRTDNSYNVYVDYDEEKVKVSDKFGVCETYKYDELIKTLTGSSRHRLLNSVLKKLKEKSTFCLKVDTKLNICGFCDRRRLFNEAYAFIGDTKNMNLVELLTSDTIGWKKGGEQDEDLVYALIYLYVKGYFNSYFLLFYNDFIVIRDLQSIDVYRLDIDYNRIFGLDLRSENNVLLFEIYIAYKLLHEVSFKAPAKTYTLTKFELLNNSIAEILKKKYDLKISELIYTGKIEQLKDCVDIDKIKSNQKLMNLLDKVKTTPEILALVGKKHTQ